MRQQSGVITPHNSLVVSVTDQQGFMRLSRTGEDDTIESCIREAQDYLERALFTSFLPAAAVDVFSFFHKFTCVAEDYPDHVRQAPAFMPVAVPFLELMRLPVTEITSIKYYTLDDTENTFASDNYRLSAFPNEARVYLKEGKTWPTGLRLHDALKIEYSIGYADADSVPYELKRAIKELATHFYEHRGDDDTDAKIPVKISNLIRRHRKIVF